MNDVQFVSSIIAVRVPGQGYVEEYTLHLWNNKGIWPGAKLVSCKLGVSNADGTFTGGSLDQGQEAVSEKWISLKSNGAGGGEYISDDAQASFKPCGGVLTDADNYIALGEMPTNCYRVIHVRIEVPEGAESDGLIYPALVLEYTLEDPSISSSSSSYMPDSDDDFTGDNGDPPDPWTWTITDPTPQIYNNQLQMDVATGNVKEGVQTKYTVSGDFEVQVDFSIPTITDTNDWYAKLRVDPQDASGDYWEATIKYNTAYYAGRIYTLEEYDYSLDILYAKVYATSDTSGKLKIGRSSGTFYAYYWNGSSWTEMVPDTDVTSSASLKFTLEVQTNDNEPSTDVLWDNFVLNIGSPTWP